MLSMVLSIDKDTFSKKGFFLSRRGHERIWPLPGPGGSKLGWRRGELGRVRKHLWLPPWSSGSKSFPSRFNLNTRTTGTGSGNDSLGA
jgi:hypothetical protein